jgi:hypothetical protein
MLAHDELRNQLVRFLGNEMSLDDFEDWFVEKSWNAQKDSDLLAQRLAYAIELRLAEYSNDHLSESELRRELLELSKQHMLTLFQSPSLQSGSSTDFTVNQWQVPSSGKPLAVAYG